MEISCEFVLKSPYNTNLYTCMVSTADINEKHHVIKAFKGVHKAGKSRRDVECIYFNSGNIKYFPRGLMKHFPNLVCLTLMNIDINEISRNDLTGLKGLIRLDIYGSGLKSIPDDLFTEMPRLRLVSITKSHIEFASSELLKSLVGRQSVKVDLRNNTNINACFWAQKENSLNSLDDLMKLIDEKCKKPVISIIEELWVFRRYSDVVVRAGGKEFKAHKAVLASRNTLFSQIFEEHSETTQITIPGFSSKAVEALLNFIYMNEIPDDDNAKENFEIAMKFKVADMKSIYGKIISQQLDESNAWESFMFAHRFALQQLKKQAFQLIAIKFPVQLSKRLMEDPEELKKLLDARQAYEETLKNSEQIIE